MNYSDYFLDSSYNLSTRLSMTLHTFFYYSNVMDIIGNIC